MQQVKSESVRINCDLRRAEGRRGYACVKDKDNVNDQGGERCDMEAK